MQVLTFTARPIIGSESITIDNTAGGIGLTAATMRKKVGNTEDIQIFAKSAFISVEDAQVRANFNPGVTVTATANGHAFDSGTSFILDGTANLAGVKFIRTTGTSGIIRVTYYG